MAALSSVGSAIRRLRIEKGFHSLPCARGGCHSPFGELEKVGETPIESFSFSLLLRTASSKQTSCLSLSSKTRHGVHLFTPGMVTASRVFFCTCSVLKSPGQQKRLKESLVRVAQGFQVMQVLWH